MFEAAGSAAFYTGSLSMIASEFPGKVATVFSITETFYGLGAILGPTIGGILYQAGGFTLPFLTLGSKFCTVKSRFNESRFNVKSRFKERNLVTKTEFLIKKSQFSVKSQF